MKITIKAKNFELTQGIEEFVGKKISSLEKFIGAFQEEIFVELEKETKHHKKGDIFLAKIQLAFPGKTLVALSRSDALVKAISKANDEIKLEIEKYKMKKIERIRRVQKKNQQNI